MPPAALKVKGSIRGPLGFPHGVSTRALASPCPPAPPPRHPALRTPAEGRLCWRLMRRAPLQRPETEAATGPPHQQGLVSPRPPCRAGRPRRLSARVQTPLACPGSRRPSQPHPGPAVPKEQPAGQEAFRGHSAARSCHGADRPAGAPRAGQGLLRVGSSGELSCHCLAPQSPNGLARQALHTPRPEPWLLSTSPPHADKHTQLHVQPLVCHTRDPTQGKSLKPLVLGRG